MRKLLLGLIALVVVGGVLLATVGVEPKDRRPGTRLAGVQASYPESWGFTDTVMEVHLETYPWFGIPFSVTTVIASKDDAAYIPSIYTEAGPFPGTKFWNRVIDADPNVRVRVNGNLYPAKIFPITDPAEFDRAFLTLAAKYPFWANALENRDERPHMALLRLAPR